MTAPNKPVRHDMLRTQGEYRAGTGPGRTVLLILRFFLELGFLVALGAWGFHAGTTWPAKLGLGLGAPLLAAAVWGAFVAPRARIRVSPLTQVVLEALVFGAATAALAADSHPHLAWCFGVAALLDGALLRLGDRGK